MTVREMLRLLQKLLHFIRQQLRLNEQEFQSLKQCVLYRSEYLELLKRKGRL